MRVLLDTNVLLDVLLDREPWARHSSSILSMADRGEIQGLACTTSFTTIFYLLHKQLGRAAARSAVSDLLNMLEVAPVGRSVLEGAAKSGIRDFEDAVVVESALAVRADCIVTRDAKDFAKSRVVVHTPKSFLGLVERLH